MLTDGVFCSLIIALGHPVLHQRGGHRGTPFHPLSDSYGKRTRPGASSDLAHRSLILAGCDGRTFLPTGTAPPTPLSVTLSGTDLAGAATPGTAQIVASPTTPTIPVTLAAASLPVGGILLTATPDYGDAPLAVEFHDTVPLQTRRATPCSNERYEFGDGKAFETNDVCVIAVIGTALPGGTPTLTPPVTPSPFPTPTSTVPSAATATPVTPPPSGFSHTYQQPGTYVAFLVFLATDPLTRANHPIERSNTVTIVVR